MTDQPIPDAVEVAPPMRASVVFAALWLSVFGLARLSAAADAGLDAWLAECDKSYSHERAMLGVEFRSPGYHTTVPDGAWVHPTRQSLDYAAALLARNAAGDADRAAAVVRKVLSLQDTDPGSRTYGIWPWLAEEPLEKMSPPDWNWADFCGARIAMMLHDDAGKLPEGLVKEMRAGLGHAAKAIVRRNVGPDYTNIAIMGGGVCAAAGEILEDKALLEYGRARLQRVVEYAARNGGFQEYNSPTYTMVALFEAERTLHLVRDEATRRAAESLRQTAWQVIAGSFHPGTQQWAGPHARSYSDYLFPSVAAYLTDQTGAEVRAHPSTGDSRRRLQEVLPHLPCPEALRERFRALPADPLEIRRTFLRRESEADSLIGTTWLAADACLGTINRGTFWTQQRPLIAYWKTGDDPAVVLRLRFLHDGRDFASMGVRIGQRGPRALATAFALAGQGDWHPGLDRPKDGTFHADDFRWRFELRGKGVGVETLADGRFALKAGERRMVVHALPGRFAGEDVVWETGRDADAAFVDAVCYRGPRKSFDFRKPPQTLLAAGVELLRTGEPAAERGPTWLNGQPGRAAWPALGR